jgi:hypothetical protein
VIDLIKALSSTPIWILALAAVAWVGRGWFEGALKSRFNVLESRIASSLEIKQGLRTHEQDELVDFRVAVEKWEYFLQTGIGDLTIEAESKDFEPADFHRRDQLLFGAVRVAAVKASIFLRDAALEVELLKTINAIRGLYYPRLEMTMRELLDLQGQMLPYLNRMRLFEASGQKDTAIALKAEEAQVLIGLRHRMTDVLQAYAEGLVADYRPIAEQLYDLKAKINVHIYRPLTSADIDSRDG